MTRGLLPDDELSRIEAGLPDVIHLRVKSLQMDPSFMYLAFPLGCDIPVTAICLQDATDVLAHSRIALHEFYAHGIYYRRYKQPADEKAAVLMERFFLDDLALRLYAAAEHLASAIIFMLELNDYDLAPYKVERQSKQSIVGHYLAEKLPELEISRAIENLAQCRDWRLSMEYRGKWVHDQPPIVQGLGIVYRRRSKWEQHGDGVKMTIRFGAGDTPDYTIEQVSGFLEKGFQALITATGACIGCFEEMLRSRGFTLSKDGGSWHLTFKSCIYRLRLSRRRNHAKRALGSDNLGF